VTSGEPAAARRVFLSYAHADQALAQRVSDALAESGVRTTDQIVQVSPGEDLAARLRETVRASDVVIALLSPAAAKSRWIGTEIELSLSSELARRGAEIIPVLVVPTDLPLELREQVVVDLTEDVNAGLRQLVAQVQATSRADFSAMNPIAFENFVADLLRASEFEIDDEHPRADRGADIRATYQHVDPFGLTETEVWLVQAKLYSHERVSVRAIRELAGTLATASGGTRGLLVTNAQLTSVAREYLAQLERGPHVRLRVLDGLELGRLLREFPEVAARHFGHETAESRLGPDGDS
jgi:hypothetical protein